MKILLVYPEMPNTCWTFREEVKLGGFKAIFPPLSLLTIAAMLPDNWEKKLNDLNIEKLSKNKIQWADYVFIGGMNVQEDSVRTIIEICKELKTPIVAGGPLFTHEHERFPDINHFILNEAEITLPPFLEDIKKGQAKRIYSTSEYANIRETPTPLWKLADLKKYSTALIQYSRGCPHMCDFCDVTGLFGREPRTKTSDQIIEELESIPNLDSVSGVFFADDNLLGNKKHLKEDLLPKLISWQRNRKRKVWFMTQLSINLADDIELMQLMLDAGFGSVFIGIETPDEHALIASKKNQNIHRSVIDNVHFLLKSGFEIWGGFIVGFDSDQSDIFQRQIDFIQELGIISANISMLYAPRGTKLYEQLKSENRLISKPSSFEAITNIIPVMDVDMLFDGFEKIVDQLYDSDLFFSRAKKFMSIYQKPEIHKQSKFVLKTYILKAIFKIFYLLGIKDKNRVQFWKLLFWTIRNRPDIIEMCPLICIRGRNFRLSYSENIAKNVPVFDELKEAHKLLKEKDIKKILSV